MNHNYSPTERQSWLALATDAAKLIVSFGIGAATYFGRPIHPLLRDNWLVVGLGCACAMAIYIIARRETGNTEANLRTIGLTNAWPRREELDMRKIFQAIEGSNNVDMMGYNLRSPYFAIGGTFDDIIREKLSKQKNLRLRILIADPDSTGLARRAEQEAGHASDRMRTDGNRSLEYLNDLLRAYPGGNLEVKLIEGDLIKCSCIFADSTVFVTPYLAHRTGNKCPVFEIAGKDTGFFKTFQREFEGLWNDGLVHCSP